MAQTTRREDLNLQDDSLRLDEINRLETTNGV